MGSTLRAVTLAAFVACCVALFTQRAHAQSASTASSARAARPPPPSAPLFQADFFTDARWTEAVREDVRAQERGTEPAQRPQLDTRTEAATQSFQRGSIDQQVLQQIIMDRTRRVAMNAVADAISEIAGPAGDRQYLRQLLTDVAALLTDRTGMQNTLIEQLVATLARAVIADAVVRLRLPGNDIADPCAWRRAVYGEEAGLDREACVNFPLKAVDGRVTLDACGVGNSLAPITRNDPPPGARTPEVSTTARPVACSFLTSESPPRPWLPTRVGNGDATRLRAYLVDLAFWSLGRTELFSRQAPMPSCAFTESSPLHGLCRLVEGNTDTPTPSSSATDGASEPSPEEAALTRQRIEDARAARAAWVSGTTDLVGAIQVAHDIMSLLRPPLNSRLRSLINAVLSTRDLGTFGRGALGMGAWNELAALTDWASAWHELAAVNAALPAFRAEPLPLVTTPGHGRPAHGHTPAPAAPPRPAQRSAAHEALRAAMITLRERLTRRWLSADGVTPSAAMAWYLTPRDAAPAGADRRVATTCPQRSVLDWLHAMTSGGLERAAAEEPGTAREEVLCVPIGLERMFPTEASPSGPSAAESEAALAQLQRAGGDARRAIEAVNTAVPGLLSASLPGAGGMDISSLSLDRVVDVVQALDALRIALDALEREWNRPAAQALWQRQPGARNLAPSFQTVHRGLSGVARMLRIAGALDVEALRDRGVGTVGAAFGSLRSLGGPVVARLGPILSIIPLDRAITIETMLVMLEHITPEDIVVSLGVAPARGRWCDEDERGLACWLQRITAVLREVTDVQDARVTIDSDRLVRTLGALGDDFRRRREWRAYFHLTIGLGEMLSFQPRVGGGFDPTFVPVMAEQIGIGIASPSFARDRLGFRAGLFGSGLLYRLVLDSKESDAFFFGAFAALDLYELLEVFVAPTALVYPPGTSSDPVSFGVLVGASVPLGDYLSRL